MHAQTALRSLLVIPGEPERLRDVRRFVRRAIGGDSERCAVAELLTSELVTNSLLHSASGQRGGTVSVAVLAVTAGIRVEVTDGGGPTVPALRDPASMTESGRGLRLVDELSDSWGCQPGHDQMMTWFEMEVSDHADV